MLAKIRIASLGLRARLHALAEDAPHQVPQPSDAREQPQSIAWRGLRPPHPKNVEGGDARGHKPEPLGCAGGLVFKRRLGGRRCHEAKVRHRAQQAVNLGPQSSQRTL